MSNRPLRLAASVPTYLSALPLDTISFLIILLHLSKPRAGWSYFELLSAIFSLISITTRVASIRLLIYLKGHLSYTWWRIQTFHAVCFAINLILEVMCITMKALDEAMNIVGHGSSTTCKIWALLRFRAFILLTAWCDLYRSWLSTTFEETHRCFDAANIVKIIVKLWVYCILQTTILRWLLTCLPLMRIEIILIHLTMLILCIKCMLQEVHSAFSHWVALNSCWIIAINARVSLLFKATEALGCVSELIVFLYFELVAGLGAG